MILWMISVYADSRHVRHERTVSYAYTSGIYNKNANILAWLLAPGSAEKHRQNGISVAVCGPKMTRRFPGLAEKQHRPKCL
jgi:hypothetical protein